MAHEIAFENGRISNFVDFGSWPWPWIGSYCMPSCIAHWPLPTRQMTMKSKKLFYGRTHRRTFETGFIRSTLSQRRPKNWVIKCWRGPADVTATPIISSLINIQNDSAFWSQLTRVVLEKRPLTGHCCQCSDTDGWEAGRTWKTLFH